jgi:UDP-N-acetylmuramoyl-tripeptide--D-alanyl-D-alanine ligase
MFPMSAQRVAAGLGAAIVQAGRPLSFKAVGIDSRRLEPGSLFIGIQGRVPGERYFDAALAAGARGLAGRRFSPAQRRLARRAGAWLFQVKDGLGALQALAADQRRLISAPVLAVTGSNGKTGAKDLLAHLLEGEGPGLATQGNLNNHLGVPLTLLRAEPGLDWVVAEAGMNHPGELSALGRLLRPTMAVVLNVGDAHAGHFGGARAAVAAAKEELLRAMGPAGLAIVNADDPLTLAMGRRHGGAVATFGLAPGADLRLEGLKDGGARGFRATARWSAPQGGRPLRLPIRMASGGRAGWTSAAAALAAALSLGADPRRLQRRLAGYEPAAKLRQQLTALPFGATGILDAYNASPQSMQAGLEYLALSARRGRRLAVLGCMLELGGRAPAFHRALGRQARAAGVEALAALGDHAADIVKGFGAGSAAFGRDQAAEAAAWIKPRLVPGAWCLFKGSRGLAVERVHAALMGD